MLFWFRWRAVKTLAFDSIDHRTYVPLLAYQCYKQQNCVILQTMNTECILIRNKPTHQPKQIHRTQTFQSKGCSIAPTSASTSLIVKGALGCWLSSPTSASGKGSSHFILETMERLSCCIHYTSWSLNHGAFKLLSSPTSASGIFLAFYRGISEPDKVSCCCLGYLFLEEEHQRVGRLPLYY
jgi:hypothetical protein